MRIDVMGVRFDNVTMAEALERAESLLQDEQTHYCVTPNSEMVYESLHNTQLQEILNRAELVLPDGGGVVLASRILRTPLKEKVAGVDFAAGLLHLLEQTGQGLYLLGGKPGIAELAAQKMLAKYPALHIVGMQNGYFQEDAPIIEAVNRSGAKVLFVCLGVPKQEYFMAKHLEDLQASLLIGLGGSLDAFAGTVKRAPQWMIRLNLEWLYRLIKEPWRYKRMLRLPKFLIKVFQKRIRGR